MLRATGLTAERRASSSSTATMGASSGTCWQRCTSRTSANPGNLPLVGLPVCSGDGGCSIVIEMSLKCDSSQNRKTHKDLTGKPSVENVRLRY